MVIDSIDKVSYVKRLNDNKIRTVGSEGKEKLLSIDPSGIELDSDIKEDQLKNAVEKANQKFTSENTRLEYSYHKKSGCYVIKIINKETDETIKQIPPQKLIDYMEGLMEYIGLHIDQKV